MNTGPTIVPRGRWRREDGPGAYRCGGAERRDAERETTMDLSKRRINPQNPARTIRGRKMRKSAILAAAAKTAMASAQPSVAAAPATAQPVLPVAAAVVREDQPEQA